MGGHKYFYIITMVTQSNSDLEKSYRDLLICYFTECCSRLKGDTPVQSGRQVRAAAVDQR